MWRLKEGGFGQQRSGWESLLHLLHGWLDGVEIMPVGDHGKLYRRILELGAGLPPPCRQTFELVRLARRRWAQAVDHWKRTGDDSQMKGFTTRFQAWIERTEQELVHKVLLELGRQLLRPRKAGNASLFWSQVPESLLRRVYGG
jgi:hypothetical protein